MGSSVGHASKASGCFVGGNPSAHVGFASMGPRAVLLMGRIRKARCASIQKPQTSKISSPQQVQQESFDHGSDVTVLENKGSVLRCFLYGDLQHSPGQIVGTNHLVGEQQPKRWVDRTQ